ncbi:hypothetical protein HDU76_007907 [Blyttiomyces sp. JEL0837]|nr:hypothetical protein HDU76_007907 [Blyttiomyces sp. JEL0837]
MTTFPKRMGKVQISLQSIKVQSRRPDTIYLSIPSKVERLNITDETFEGRPLTDVVADLELKFGPGLKVLRTDDWGPSTKLLGALQHEKHDDVWISGIMYRRNYRPYLLMPGFETVLSHHSSGNLSVGKVPFSERDHRDPCIRYFDYFI